ELMSDFGRGAAFINLTRDRGYGKVTIDADGNAVPQYLFTDELDVKNFRIGLERIMRMHKAAGAEGMISLARKDSIWREGEDFEAFVERPRDGSLAPREHAIFSAHQMGSCRMGRDPKTSVANPWGELHDTRGVWIGDASAFPTSSGTNPMITIMALAHRTAGAI